MPKKVSAWLLTATVLSATLAGCSSKGFERSAASASRATPQLAAQIEKALTERQFSRALEMAEALVAASPQDAEHRVLLGRAYLAGGRYHSARTAFADAMTLGNRDVRTIVSLALSDTALGNGAEAYALLTAHIDDLPAEDYGLAMAIVGDAEEGIRALVHASRQPTATARTRQNLAFALAVGGAWGQARLIAGQDLSAKEAEKRIGQWSQALTKHDPGERVAVMTGVLPRTDDAGLPVHLALRDEPAPVMVAAMVAAPALPIEQPDQATVSAPSIPSEQPAQSSSSSVASAANGGESGAPLASVIAAIQPLSEAAEAAQIARTQVPQAPTQLEAQAPAAAPAAVQVAALAPLPHAPTQALTFGSATAASGWVVQLGAYNSQAVAREKGQQIVRSHTMLTKLEQVYSAARIRGRMFYRLAVRGFTDRNAASSLCNTLTNRGQDCFVRQDRSEKVGVAQASNRSQVTQRISAPSIATKQYAAR